MGDLVSVNDLFLSGIVFDIVGAYILVSGLLLPGEMVFRLGSTWEGLESLSGEDRCRNRARAEFGFGLLAVGFLLQGAGYFLEITGSPVRSSGDRAFVAGLFMVIALGASVVVWLTLGHRRERQLLDDFAERQAEQKEKADKEAASSSASTPE